MSAPAIKVPFPNFGDRNGQPLDNGNVYIGTAFMDAEENQIQVYWDDALTIPAFQPIKTSGGYFYRNGTIANIFVNGDYSMTVKDSQNTLVYTAEAVSGQGAFGAILLATDTALEARNDLGILSAAQYAANGGAALIGTASGNNLQVVLDGLDSQGDALATASVARYMPRIVPPEFIRGDGSTRTDIFPLQINYPGPGGSVLTKTPLDIASELGNVVVRATFPDIHVTPTGAGTNSGDSLANAMPWATAWQTNTTARKLLIYDVGTYQNLPLVAGTHAGAAVPKWLKMVDGRMRVNSGSTNLQPAAMTVTLTSGYVYQATMVSTNYDIPTAMLKTLVPNPVDGKPDSMKAYSSIAALTALGDNGEGWFYDRTGAYGPARTLYWTYYGTDQTVVGNRNFHIVYANTTLDSFGEFSAEWVMTATTVIFEGKVEMDGVWINMRQSSAGLPVFLAQTLLDEPTFSLASASYGFRAEGLCYLDGWQSIRSKYDGFNAYKGSFDGSVGFSCANNYFSLGSGDIGTWGTSGRTANNQGWSVHDKCNTMLFGSLIQAAFGPGWADVVGTTHNSCSWGGGVVSRYNYADSGISNGFYFDGSGDGTRTVYLDTCMSVGNTRDLVVVDAAANIYNNTLPTRLALSGGTITTYSPEAP